VRHRRHEDMRGTPTFDAAYATAAPWLPPDAATTPAAGTGRRSRLVNAPRTLNEPDSCVCSSFRVSGNGGRPKSAPVVCSTGVSRIRGAIAAYARSMPAGVKDALMSAGADKVVR
jgi:hypothetical protein